MFDKKLKTFLAKSFAKRSNAKLAWKQRNWNIIKWKWMEELSFLHYHISLRARARHSTFVPPCLSLSANHEATDSAD
jgi:hypothetical protein